MQQAGINTPGGGGGERTLRDLGVLAYLEATGRPVQPPTASGSSPSCASWSRRVGSARSP